MQCEVGIDESNHNQIPSWGLVWRMLNLTLLSSQLKLIKTEVALSHVKGAVNAVLEQVDVNLQTPANHLATAHAMGNVSG